MSNKKIKWLRRAVIAALLIIVAAAVFLSSVINENNQRKLMKLPQLSRPELYRTASIDASSASYFTDLNTAGENFDKVAENEFLALYVNKDNSGIEVYDKASQKTWRSIPSSELLENAETESRKHEMLSMLNFSYIELTSSVVSATVVPTTSSQQEHTVTREKIWGGVRLNFDFTALNIKASVDILIDDGSLVVNLPDDKLIENEAGVEQLAEFKSQLEKEIESIRKVCEEIKSASEKNAYYSTSKKKTIDLKMNEALKVLVTIKNNAGTGKLNVKEMDQLYRYIDDVLKLTSDMTQLSVRLESIKEKSSEMVEIIKTIAQGSSAGFIELSIMPFFGAQADGTDGYAFYPDGSGALSYFNKKHPAMAGRLRTDIYSDHAGIGQGKDSNNIALPVFGIKAEESGFLANITAGDYDAALNFYPITTDRAISYIYPSFYFRNSTTLVNNAGGHTYVYDTVRVHHDREVRYSFLSGEKANYNGMAEAYKTYLKATGQLNKSPLLEKEEMPLAVNFFMGAYSENSTLNEKLIVGTKYDDILKFLKRLENQDINNVVVGLSNWSDKMWIQRPQSLDSASQTGGNKGLAELSSYIRERNQLLVPYLELVWIDSTKVSFAKSSVATVKAKSQMTRTDGLLRALNPSYILNEMQQSGFKKLKSHGFNSVEISDINGLYFDYNKNAVSDRSLTAKQFAELAKTARAELGTFSSDYPSRFLLAHTDYAMVYEGDSQALYTDEGVPFYQMVLHGNIQYSGNDFNYFYSETQEKLKLIEYGYIPSYYLTEEDTTELRNYGVKGLYSTVLNDWEDKIVETYNTFSTSFNEVWNQEIILHERLSETLSAVTYQNGKKIYVNYAAQEVTVEGHVVKPESYLVI